MGKLGRKLFYRYRSHSMPSVGAATVTRPLKRTFLGTVPLNAGRHPGIYVGVKFDAKSCAMLSEWSGAHLIPNAVPAHEFHATIIFSRDFFAGYEVLA
jgi:hypothetical protein